MTTSRTSFLTEIADGKTPIPERKFAYFRERQRNRLYDFIISKFLEREKSGFTRADLARRLQKRPEQVTRWLSTPGNWTLDTISDLTLAVCGEELDFEIHPFSGRSPRNTDQFALLSHTVETAPAIFQGSIQQYTSKYNQGSPPLGSYGLGTSSSKQEGIPGAHV